MAYLLLASNLTAMHLPGVHAGRSGAAVGVVLLNL
jgi:hypothetical protein